MKNIDAVEVDDDESEGNDLPIGFGEADNTNVFRVDPATHKGATEAIADGAIAKSNIAAEVTITEVIALCSGSRYNIRSQNWHKYASTKRTDSIVDQISTSVCGRTDTADTQNVKNNARTVARRDSNEDRIL